MDNENTISNWIYERRKLLLFLILVFVVPFVFSFAFFYYKNDFNLKAAKELLNLENLYSKYEVNSDSKQKEEILKSIANIIKKYNKTYYSQKAYIIDGKIKILDKKEQEAIESYKMALKSKETYLNPLLYMNIGLLYEDLGKLDDAVDFLNKSISTKQNPQVARSLFSLGRIYEKQGKYTDAKAQYEKITREFTSVYKNLSESRLLILKLEKK